MGEPSEEEIRSLMAKEIADEACSSLSIEYRDMCSRILYKILMGHENPEALKQLPEDARYVLLNRLVEEFGLGR